MRGKDSGEMRGSGERRSREFEQQNDRGGQRYGYDNQDRFQGDRDRFQGDRDRYQGNQDRYQGDQRYDRGGANYQNEQDRYRDDKRYQSYYQDDPRYPDDSSYRGDLRYPDNQGDSYQRGRDDYQGGRSYREDREPNRDRYQEGKGYNNDNWERQTNNPRGYEQDRYHYDEQRYPRDPGYHDKKNDGYRRNEETYTYDGRGRGDWRPAGGERRDNDDYYNNGYDDRRRERRDQRGGGGEYVDEGRYERDRNRNGRGGGGGGQYREEERRKKQQNQQQIEPLVKPTATESSFDDFEIKSISKCVYVRMSKYMYSISN